MRQLHIMAAAAAARMLLHRRGACVERGCDKAHKLLMLLESARASGPAAAATLRHADVQSILAAFFEVQSSCTTFCREHPRDICRRSSSCGK